VQLLALLCGRQVVQFDKRLRDGADCDAFIVDPLNGMSVGDTAKGQFSRRVFNVVATS